jgi:hypothetical protein
VDEVQLLWFDRWLKDVRNDVELQDRVRVFATGANEWRSIQSLEGSEKMVLFLSSRGRANSLDGDGRLRQSQGDDEPPDVYVYEPLSPTLAAGAQPSPAMARGPVDQRSVERLNNVLVYSTTPLQRAAHVLGNSGLNLWVSSTAPDTDFVAKLIDVHPRGEAILVGLVPLRARFRESLVRPTLLVPGGVYELRLRFPFVSHVFDAGHSIRLEIASSCFPLFDRNPNTGAPAWTAGPLEMRTATQWIFHDRSHPSALLLPTASS